MKKLLFAALLLLPFVAKAQLYYSDFALENEALTHIKVFEPTDTANLKNRVVDMLSLTTGIVNVQDRGDYVIADIEKMNLDYKKHGAKPFWFPMIVQNGINGRIRVDIKDGRYRTSVNAIEFINTLEATTYGVTAKGTNQTIERCVLNRDRTKFKNTNKWNKVLFYMDKDFTDKFTLAAPVASEDW